MSDKFVTSEVEAQRLSVCYSCDKLTDYTNNTLVTFVSKWGVTAEDAAKSICNICECPVRYRAKKAKMACPLDKWKE